MIWKLHLIQRRRVRSRKKWMNKVEKTMKNPNLEKKYIEKFREEDAGNNLNDCKKT